MQPDAYIEQRVDDQIAWYDRKSIAAQRMFKRLRVAEILAAALVPVLVGFADRVAAIRIIVGVLGAVVVVLASLISLGKYQEHWLEYRTACESLKHEKFLFLTGAEPYQGEDRFPLFVQRVEGLISKENSAWARQTRVAPKRDGAVYESIG